jgi:hypothetical protein
VSTENISQVHPTHEQGLNNNPDERINDLKIQGSGAKPLNGENRTNVANASDQASRDERIAVAAYYNAEHREFGGNGELDDWLAAERQMDGKE